MRGPYLVLHGIHCLVFHGTARAIRLMNSLLDGKKENTPNIHRQYADNSSIKYFFHEISPKSLFQGFPLIFKFPENFPKTNREFSER